MLWPHLASVKQRQKPPTRVMNKTYMPQLQSQSKNGKTRYASSENVTLTKIVANQLYVGLCIMICPDWRSHSWNNLMGWLQFHETNTDVTTISLSFANESQISSEGTTDSLKWRPGQIIDSSSPNMCYRCAQKATAVVTSMVIQHRTQQDFVPRTWTNLVR